MVTETTRIVEAMQNSMETTLEDLVFSAVEPLEEEGERGRKDEGYCACLELIRPLVGEAFIWMPEDLLFELAVEIFGEDLGSDSGAKDPIRDTLGEIMNTTAGKFLEQLTPDDEEFDIGLPQVQKGLPGLEGAAVCWLTVNDRPCFMAVRLEK